jgi:hypothetical protein
MSAKEIVDEATALTVLKEVPPIEEFPEMSILIINGEVLSRDWPEDAVHENGNYNNECYICHNQFIAHKRTVCCKLCNEGAKQ